MFALDAIFGHSPGHNTALNKNIYIKIHRACLVRRRTSNVAHKSLCAKNRIHPESAAAEPTRHHQSCFYILVFALGNHYLCDVRNVLLRCSVGATRSQSAAKTVFRFGNIYGARMGCHCHILVYIANLASGKLYLHVLFIWALLLILMLPARLAINRIGIVSGAPRRNKCWCQLDTLW